MGSHLVLHIPYNTLWQQVKHLKHSPQKIRNSSCCSRAPSIRFLVQVLGINHPRPEVVCFVSKHQAIFSIKASFILVAL
ncbi:unnamed protein product [Linum trigynum]|uniref:Uncharacterized protein n=1 Tax=Linum trigynum TaxID=586398 RepID=A0AAV2D0K9_9ROSI